jgi:ubiquinone/menaquinone biosynthesis C-methylase UbiE
MSSVSYRTFTGTGAENYQRYFVPAIATPVSADLLAAAALQPGEKVLDVACGTGVIARLAAEAVGPTGSVTGVDVAPDMIEVAKATTVPAGAAIEWHVSDAASLSFADETYDVALCQMGLMFMEDRAGALAELRRVMKPGGRVAINTPGTIQPPFELMEQAIVEHISADLGGFVRAVFSMPDPAGLATLLEEAGFADVTSSNPVTRFHLDAPAEFLWQYINLTPMGPFVAEASEEAKAAMERQVVEAWQPWVKDGKTPVDQPMALATGRK